MNVGVVERDHFLRQHTRIGPCWIGGSPFGGGLGLDGGFPGLEGGLLGWEGGFLDGLEGGAFC